MSTMKDKFRHLRKITILLMLCGFAGCVTTAVDNSGAPSSAKPYEKDLWIEDFHQLQNFMSTGYPNLEWQRDHLHLNLPELSQRTVAALTGATSDAEAQQILSRFLETFHDSHIHLNLKKPAVTTSLRSFTKEDEGATVCQALGMRNKDNSFRFTPSAGYQKLSSSESPFRYGIVRTRKSNIGIIRVASFVPTDYAAICIDEWNHYRTKLKDICSKDCLETFLSEVMENRLLREADHTISDLNRKQIDMLLVDLTHNGGGTSWEAGFRNMLTAKTLDCGSSGFIRHPHWVTQFENDLRDLHENLDKAKSDVESAALSQKILVTEQDLAEARKGCERDALWTDASFKPACSLVATRHGDSCNIWQGYRYNTGLYNGPLFVLVDSYTSSASEDVAARYQDSRAATIIGERTDGSGCGYTNGGIPYVLKHSNIEVRISDCVRFRKNGDNEVDGIKPDVEIDMKPIKEPKFFDRLMSILEKS